MADVGAVLDRLKKENEEFSQTIVQMEEERTRLLEAIVILETQVKLGVAASLSIRQELVARLVVAWLNSPHDFKEFTSTNLCTSVADQILAMADDA